MSKLMTQYDDNREDRFLKHKQTKTVGLQYNHVPRYEERDYRIHVDHEVVITGNK